MKIIFCKNCGCMMDVDESTGRAYCSACGYKEGEPEASGEATPSALSDGADLGETTASAASDAAKAKEEEHVDPVEGLAQTLIAISKGETAAAEETSAHESEPEKKQKKAPAKKREKPPKEKKEKPKKEKKAKPKRIKIKKDIKTDVTLFVLIFASICNLLLAFIDVLPISDSASTFFIIQTLITSAHIMMGLCDVDFYILKKNGTLFGALHLVCAALSCAASVLIAVIKEAAADLIPTGILCTLACLFVGWLSKKGEQTHPYVTAAVLLPICLVCEVLIAAYGNVGSAFHVIANCQVVIGHLLFAAVAFFNREIDWGVVHIAEPIAAAIVITLLL